MTDIQVTWLNDGQNIIIYHFNSDFNWDTFRIVGNLAYQMMDTVNHPVIEILDLRDIDGMPPNTLTQGRLALRQEPHPRIKMIIIVGINSYLNAIYRVFERMLPTSWINKWNFIFVDSIEEAYAKANEYLDN